MKNTIASGDKTGRRNPEKSTGITVPLGALYTETNSVIGEYSALPAFAEFAKKSGLKVIQLLPVNDTGTQSSPYSGLSAFALHPIYIDIKALPEFADASKSDKKFAKSYAEMVKKFPYDKDGRYDYSGILTAKTELLMRLYESTETAQEGKPSEKLEKWIKANPWIVNYAVYKNLKDKYKQATWKDWEEKDRHPKNGEIQKRWDNKTSKKAHLFYAWLQMRASEQFKKSTDAVRKLGITLKGDMPILMNEDSCDAWALPGIFNHNLRAGSPVDGENPTGQNWGFPTYNWDYLKEHNYDWWIDRLKSAEQYYSAYRLDHILGFFRIWAIPVRDTTAVLGHTVPYSVISKEELNSNGFDNARIRWLSAPHVHTGTIEDITWNHDAACSILGLFMNRINNEELWLFKPEVSGDKDFYEADLSNFCTEDAARRIKDVLSQKWRDRALLEIEEGKFVPVWTYYTSTAWNSLNSGEQDALRRIIENNERAQNELWKRQSDEILSTLTKSVNMVPCGEDLGANLPCLPSVMQNNGILALRVIRWCRQWNIRPDMPYTPLGEITPLSVSTSSVHDSPTLRQWWDEDKAASALFVRSNPQHFVNDTNNWGEIDAAANSTFTPEIAENYLKTVAHSASVWCVHPLQDYLAMERSYWLSDPNNERVNIPGSVSEFNWTYRMPVSLKELSSNENLINKIKNIAELHEGRK
ncbi:MAG: 4-alpha-glucanotransferase [Treponema sp.]